MDLMRSCVAAAAALFLSFAPSVAGAVTISGVVPFDPSGEAIVYGPIFSDPGTYRYSFTLDRPAAAEIYLFAQETYNWFGVDDGVYYGGDAVPIEPVFSFLTPGTSGEGLFTLKPPYENFYPGDPYIHELGYFFMKSAELRIYGNPGDPPIGFTFTGELLSAVPEPAHWALLIAGFGLVGGSLRYRRPANAVPLAA